MKTSDFLKDSNQSWLNLLALCITWAAVLILFQDFVVERLKLARPDRSLSWTITATQEDPFEKTFPEGSGFYRLYPNKHAAWDSGFFLSIATAGYDDPVMGRVDSGEGYQVSKSYAFMPLYPLLIKTVVYLVEKLFLFSDANAPVYAAMFISFLGTFVGIISLADIVRQESGSQQESYRTTFYMLIFPSSFFLIQVYAEGLFVGLALGCLALLRRKQWFVASLLVGGAFLTRMIGIGLVIPLVVTIASDTWLHKRNGTLEQKDIWLKVISILIPLTIFAAWYASPLGRNLFIVERNFFGRQAFGFQKSWSSWSNVIADLGKNPETTAYYTLEFASIGLALVSCLMTARKYLPETLFGLFVIIISVFSGVAQSMFRYMLIVPNTFIFLGYLGKYKTFDKAWTLLSILFLGMQLILFTFDMWVG
jgi:hypothetical protein